MGWLITRGREKNSDRAAIYRWAACASCFCASRIRRVRVDGARVKRRGGSECVLIRALRVKLSLRSVEGSNFSCFSIPAQFVSGMIYFPLALNVLYSNRESCSNTVMRDVSSPTRRRCKRFKRDLEQRLGRNPRIFVFFQRRNI